MVAASFMGISLIYTFKSELANLLNLNKHLIIGKTSAISDPASGNLTKQENSKTIQNYYCKHNDKKYEDCRIVSELEKSNEKNWTSTSKITHKTNNSICKNKLKAENNFFVIYVSKDLYSKIKWNDTDNIEIVEKNNNQNKKFGQISLLASKNSFSVEGKFKYFVVKITFFAKNNETYGDDKKQNTSFNCYFGVREHLQKSCKIYDFQTEGEKDSVKEDEVKFVGNTDNETHTMAKEKRYLIAITEGDYEMKKSMNDLVIYTKIDKTYSGKIIVGFSPSFPVLVHTENQKSHIFFIE